MSVSSTDSSNQGTSDDTDPLSMIENNREELIELRNSDLPVAKVAAALINIYEDES